MKKLILIISTFFVLSNTFAQIINIPDANFKAKLLMADSGVGIAYGCNGISFKIDSNNNGEIEVSEALEVCRLNITYAEISDMTGIEYFTNLEKLFCYDNLITEFDATTLTNLSWLSIYGNLLTNINLTGLSDLDELFISNNQLTTLDISDLSSLVVLQCGNNLLTSLYVQEPLVHLYCSNNLLETLDVSELSNLYSFDCSSNNLVSLNVNNGSIEHSYSFDFSNNNNLQYVCADYEQLEDIENRITQYGYNNCYTNSICTFVEGEDFYTIQGNVKFDENEDGCDSNDVNYPSMLLSFSDGTNNGDVLADFSGDYHYNIQAGTYTITPQLTNPNYFSIFPTTISVTFPDQNSPFVQDFCIESNGLYPDLTIDSSSFEDYAPPGEEASYTLEFSNKGTITQSGSVNFTFDNDVTNFISSNPPITNSDVNLLVWDFNDLQPFETREIVVTLYINSPTDDPPLNDGDILDFIVSVIPSETDETPEDNTYFFSQIISTIVLDTPVFEFSDYFKLYPNPTDSQLNLIIEREIEVKSFTIYNVSGQLIKTIPIIKNATTIDVSNLESGVYFINILSDKGNFYSKFIRK